MPVEVILPKVDMDMSHGIIAVWHVAEGETVAKGAALFDIETDKAAMEVEAPASGRLHAVAARPGDRVAVGTVVALILAEGEDVGATAGGQARPAAAAADAGAAAGPGDARGAVGPALPREGADGPRGTPAAPLPADGAAMAAGAAAEQARADPAGTGRRATPAARAQARLAGVDLAGVGGSGPRGRIQRGDVTALAGARAAFPAGAAPPPTWARQAGPLHVGTRAGAGVPLVLLHGLTADSQSWAPLEKALGGNRPLIRIDLPGHGRSPRRRVADFAELARMVVEAFDAATSDHGRVDLLGHSLGGALALALADIRPRRIATLSLVAPAGLGPEIDARTLVGIAGATRAESLAPWLRRLTARPEAISDGYARAAMLQRADAELRAFQTGLADILFPDGVQPFDLRPALSRLACPTALVWGRQDLVLPWRQAIAVTGDFALHLLADAGHVPQIECPDRLARILGHHLSGPTAES